jgi:SSS family transporter
MIERLVVLAYLGACILIGLLASRRVLGSDDEYWVAGRRIGTGVNAMAIMATLASGGSIIGVMGLAYARGLPSALALFAGAVVGFPLASILVARPLRNFGRFTLTDFLVFRYPHGLVRVLVPSLIVACFTAYIVAQMKAAGVTANVLLGIPYDTALTVATLIFVLYVSIGGMLAVTWTDVAQGCLMVAVVLGAAAVTALRHGGPFRLLAEAAVAAPALGAGGRASLASDLGAFVIWAAAIPVIPHVVMRVFTARDVRSARLSLNLAMVLYSVMILAAVLVLVPVGKMRFPELADADRVFLRLMQSEFPPWFRSLAVAAVLAAVMSTTDALLLACSSAVAHDLLGPVLDRRLGRRPRWVGVGAAWGVGLLAMGLAYSPPALITEFYSTAIGLLTAAFFVPTLAGLWWPRANRAGGVASLLTGAGVYLAAHHAGCPAFAEILYALPASAAAMAVAGWLSPADSPEMRDAVSRLHDGAAADLTGDASGEGPATARAGGGTGTVPPPAS